MKKVKNWKIKYKNFLIVQSGTESYPWNVYDGNGAGFGEHVTYAETVEKCKKYINAIIERGEEQ